MFDEKDGFPQRVALGHVRRPGLGDSREPCAHTLRDAFVGGLSASDKFRRRLVTRIA